MNNFPSQYTFLKTKQQFVHADYGYLEHEVALVFLFNFEDHHNLRLLVNFTATFTENIMQTNHKQSDKIG